MSQTAGENQFLTFAHNAVYPDNILNYDEYAANIRRRTGFVAGEPADNALVNTVLRSTTTAIKGLTDLVAMYGTDIPYDVPADVMRDGMQHVINEMMGKRIIEVITPLLAAMQAQIDLYADAYHGVPVGGILPIAVTQDELAAFLTKYPNYALCDGTNGTIDLRDKFIVGAGPQCPTGTEGGTRTCDKVEVEKHAITIAELPQHKHEVPGTSNAHEVDLWPFGAPHNAETYIGSSDVRGYKVYSSPTGQTKGHNHNLKDKTVKGESNLPPYKSVIYVQKIRPY